jgi:hypothetical protein
VAIEEEAEPGNLGLVAVVALFDLVLLDDISLENIKISRPLRK